MSETVAQLLATFDTLSTQEQHELVTEMLRRSGEPPETFVTDDHLVGLADDVFQALDAKESDDRKSGAK